jgi:mannosyltransferase OCH1-like enzyme
MEKTIAISIIAFALIAIALSLTAIRNDTIQNYRDSFTNGDKKPLKYIPKKIFQLIADKKNIDPKFQKNIDYIRKLNPDWKYSLMDDNDIIEYIKEFYGPDILDLYLRINPKYGAARADLFRYLLMYREGGVYFDIKSASSIPLSKMILPEDEYILAHWALPTQAIETGNIDGEFQQWHIICRPYHPFLYYVIQNVLANIENYSPESMGVGKPGVLKVTGPIIYTKTISPIRYKYSHRLVEFDEYIGLVYNNLSSGFSLQTSHIGLFSKPHYSKINEPIILPKIND